MAKEKKRALHWVRLDNAAKIYPLVLFVIFCLYYTYKNSRIILDFRGLRATFFHKNEIFLNFFAEKFGSSKILRTFATANKIRRGIRLTVRTEDSHSSNRSSILLSRTKALRLESFFCIQEERIIPWKASFARTTIFPTLHYWTTWCILQLQPHQRHVEIHSSPSLK